jgi:glycosyltransferase involved in cell wall biosynthesis
MKVSIITAVFNCEEFLEECIKSVVEQLYQNIEYIVVDGKSTDGTSQIINKYRQQIHHFVSERDFGMYDALNKGIAMATGDVVGILNADDFLVDTQVVLELVRCLTEQNCDAVYGNLNYVKRSDTTVISRRWLSRKVELKDFERGWMPAHPTLFIKRKYFELYGNYLTNLGSAADYELILRFLYTYKLKAVFLNKLLVNMRSGGMSNGSWLKIFRALRFDYRSMVNHKLPRPFMALVLKKARKLNQYF